LNSTYTADEEDNNVENDANADNLNSTYVKENKETEKESYDITPARYGLYD